MRWPCLLAALASLPAVLRAEPVPSPPAGPATVSFPLTVASTLTVEHDVSVTTRVSGVVESIQADRGAVVKKGQPLATLDQREFDLDRRAAEETLRVSRTDYERCLELRRLDLLSQAELEQKKAQLELAVVEEARARLVIDRSVIRAPFDGVVVERSVREGEKVLLDESRPLFRVAALEPLLARAFVPAAALSRLKAGDPVAVAAPDADGVRAAGRVTFVSPVIDPASGTVQVIVRVERDGRGVLRPGSAVLLTLGGRAAP